MKQENPTITLKQQVIALLQESERPLTKNQLAKALNLKDEGRVELKSILRELKENGEIHRGSGRRLAPHVDKKPMKGLLLAEISDIDEDGEIYATAIETELPADLPLRLVDILPNFNKGPSALAIGSHVVLKIIKHTRKEIQATVVRRIEKLKSVRVGLFSLNSRGGYLSALNRKETFAGVQLSHTQCEGLSAGDVVEYNVRQGHEIKILRKLGKFDDPNIFSEIAIHAHNIPYEFSDEAINQAAAGKIPPVGQRIDYRHLDLVTIDGEDARDFDDAVWAQADDDPRNQGGWRLIVAIADVAYYVRPNSALDREAHLRGNSVYFPDRVVPMLPEALSNEMCSLKPNVDRACMVAEMVISSNGKVKSHRIKRGLMRSKARLTYNQVENAIKGNPDAQCSLLLDSVIMPLYGAYKSLVKARTQRGTLELDIPERRIVFNDEGRIAYIALREQLESNKLIEEFMIAANVAAAKTLLSKNWPCMYRVHDIPDSARIDGLRSLLKNLKLRFAKAAKPTPQHFNELLQQVRKHRFERMINQLVLRSQAQARYSPDNIGHFGLSLAQYAHFTSPIRRYSDLVVHRSLIASLDLGEGGYDRKPDNLTKVGDHISKTERTASTAEREVSERLAIAYVTPRVGETFETVVVGVNRSGLFVEIPEFGVEGFIPKGSMDDLYMLDEPNHRLIGKNTKKTFQLGQTVTAVLVEANAVINSLSFRLPNSDFSKGAGKKTAKPFKETKVKKTGHFKNGKIKKSKKAP